jgi:hypothetical protein
MPESALPLCRRRGLPGRLLVGKAPGGGIVNQSRNLVIGALSYGPHDPAWREEVVRWAAAFPYVARHSGGHFWTPWFECGVDELPTTRPRLCAELLCKVHTPVGAQKRSSSALNRPRAPIESSSILRASGVVNRVPLTRRPPRP